MSRSTRYDPDDEPLHAPPVTRCGMTHKVCFESHEEAAIRITELVPAPPVMRSYRCHFCGQWHLTSQPISE